MKSALLTASLIFLAGFAQAKDRYVVLFKSEQGFKAMQQYFMTESTGSPVQQSLSNVQGLVLKTTNAALINSLRNHPEVSLVEPEVFHPVPKPVNGFKMSKVARVDYIESARKKRNPLFDNSPDAPSAGIPEFKAGADTPWGILAVHAGDAWAQSAAGAKSRVMVLDTGIDEKHPAIAANFEKGKNFVAEQDGRTLDDKYQDTEGHGTHVSGTILGVYNEATGFTGVAPKAKLLMGRVCGTEGCSSVAIIQGINWAIQEKVDVISMSLGGPVSSTAEKQANEKADKAGIVVVAASGNGADVAGYSPNRKDPKCGGGGFFGGGVECGVSYPGAFPTVVGVGAVDSSLVKAVFSQWGPELDVTGPGVAVKSSVPMGSGRESQVSVTINGTQTAIKSAAFAGTELFPTALVNSLVAVPGTGKPEDFAKVAIAGKFALVSRGEITFADKVKNAIQAKAAGVLIYNNAEGLMQGSLSEDGSLVNLPVVMIEKTEGAALVAELAKGSAVSAGVATVPADYAVFDGTSMATPHVAGVVALIRSANKSLTPAQVRAILSSTAKPLAPNDTNQYGAGIVQADAAVLKAVGR